MEKNIIVPVIVGNETHIKQILMNIVGNAAKFTPAGGRNILTATQQDEEENKVATRTKELKGTGLGMAISKLLIDAINGKITV